VSENLLLVARDFVRRSRKHSQAEDFFTEVLAGLLRLSSEFRRLFLALVLQDPSHPATTVPRWNISTQEEAEAEGTRYGTPDLVLEAARPEDVEPSYLIAVEAKLDATLRTDQLTRYDEWLGAKEREYADVHLVALTTSERARHAAESARGQLQHWAAWIRWSQVEDILSSVLVDPPAEGELGETRGRERHEFQVYGRAFAALLADEGLVPPSPLRPGEDAALFQGEDEEESRRRQVSRAHLLHQALRDSRTLPVLEERQFNWEPIRVHDGLPHRTQHQRGVQLRQRFQAGPFRGTFFSFGLAYHVKGWLLREAEDLHDLEHLELVAALEVWDTTGSKETQLLSRDLSGENRMVRPVDELCNELNRTSALTEKVFVPSTEYRWAKFACRRSTRDLARRTKKFQKTEMGDFCYAFVQAFKDVSGKALGYPEVSLLRAIEKSLESSGL
jgi:hypothetical protein